MDKEDYVSLECAKLLKEKGYCWPCGTFYTLEGFIKFRSIADNFNRLTAYSRPTLYEAQKWLRGRGYYVEVGIYEKYVWAFVVYGYDDECCLSMVFSEKRYNTYEEALSAGIIEALKLI